jgi:hypothetical protein
MEKEQTSTDWVSNVTMVMNSLQIRRINYNVIDEENQIRIEIGLERPLLTGIVINELIWVPITPNSEQFVLVENRQAWEDWIDYNWGLMKRSK